MIYYLSRTGNVRYIVKEKLKLQSTEISDDVKANEPYLLITYTDALGEVPKQVLSFLERNHKHCVGVVASGNTNFGLGLFARAADVIHSMYDIPIVHKVEMRGFQADYNIILDFYNSNLRERDNNGEIHSLKQ